MLKNNSKSLKKFVLFFVANLVSLFLIAGIISNLKGFEIKDVLFIEGIFILMVGLFSSISGSPQSLSLQEFGQVNPQYFASISLEDTTIENQRAVSVSNIQVSVDLFSTSMIIGSVIVLISSYIL